MKAVRAVTDAAIRSWLTVTHRKIREKALKPFGWMGRREDRCSEVPAAKFAVQLANSAGDSLRSQL